MFGYKIRYGYINRNLAIPLFKREKGCKEESLKQSPSANRRRKLYMKLWNSYTRIMSTIHSSIIILICFYIIYLFKHDPYTLLDFNFPTMYPKEMLYIKYMNIVMLVYLVIDFLFLISEDTEKNIDSTITHHVAGALGMLGFINYNILAYNSLYCSLTEITTIFLNISWFMMKSDYNKSNFRLFIFIVNTFILWILWLVIRIGGGIMLFVCIFRDYKVISELGIIPIFMIFVVNSIVFSLNILWFYKLTIKIIEQFHLKQK